MLGISLLAATCLATGANAQNISAIDSSNRIVTVSSTSPGTVVSTRAITGLGSGQRIVAFDGRPAAGGRIFYGVSNTGQLYSINSRTGAAAAVGAPIALQGTAFGLDFNPTVDRIRLISNTGQNLRINPDTGAVTVDGPLNVVVGGQRIRVMGDTAAAYTNNFPGATSTTLFVINTQTGLLQIQTPPNDGTLQAVGGLGGAAAGTVSGFDISIGGGNRVSVIQGSGQTAVTNLYSVNLQTGAATFIGQFATGVLEGLAFEATAFAAESGLTGNQGAVAGALDNFTSVDPGFVSLLTTLDRLPDAAARANAFTQLSGSSFGILPEVVLQTTDMVDRTVRTYLSDFRGGGTPGGSGRVMINEGRGIGGFLVGTARTGDFEARGDRSEVRYGSTGVIGGLDIGLGQALVGITAGYDSADFNLNPITRNSRVETWFVGGYGTANFGPVFLDLVGSYGKSDLSLRRNVAFSTFNNNASANADTRYYAFSATAGLNGSFGGLEVEPYVGARYADVRIDEFSEGAGLTNLTVGQQDVESLQGVAGVRVGADFPSGSVRIRPSVRAEYRREFENDEGRLVQASFNGPGIGSPFSTTTTPLDDEQIVVGAGLTIAGESPVSLVTEYSGQIDGGYNIHEVRVGLRIRL
jgi:uncharacterized protein with beta-barrel porin domain